MFYYILNRISDLTPVIKSIMHRFHINLFNLVLPLFSLMSNLKNQGCEEIALRNFLMAGPF
ncbi:hypothetical protein MYP_2959 [Sporocytophaga myxococcoides]|uniref:Uncharacterized protein n=1 Tax=Sporocytophaga myxococcoides TaxID=153721 RepID=A0A098LFJ8_9BACT|nr:hypothetical protein MYP_2959 [Sporocytophaga myxococcoides]